MATEGFRSPWRLEVRWIGHRNGAGVTGRRRFVAPTPVGSPPAGGDRSTSADGGKQTMPGNPNPFVHDGAKILLGEAGAAHCDECGDAVRLDPRIGSWRTVQQPGPQLPPDRQRRSAAGAA